MDYWVIYSILLTYYILGFIYFLIITKNKTDSRKYLEFKKTDHHNELQQELLIEATEF